MNNIDKGIRLVKDNIKLLSRVSKNNKRVLKSGVEDVSDVSSKRNTVTLMLAYSFYILDVLKSVKSDTHRVTHTRYVNSVNGDLLNTSNKRLNSHILSLNSKVLKSMYGIPDEAISNAIKGIKCCKCQSNILKQVTVKEFLPQPYVYVICKSCGFVSAIEFSDTPVIEPNEQPLIEESVMEAELIDNNLGSSYN